MLMHRQIKKTFGLLWIGLFLIGCGTSKSKSSHTHLWTPNRQQHVWSYERVVSTKLGNEELEAPYQYLSRELRSGETVELDGGGVVSFDGAQLRVGQQLIRANNVHVERDGSIRLNAFIRESD